MKLITTLSSISSSSSSSPYLSLICLGLIVCSELACSDQSDVPTQSELMDQSPPLFSPEIEELDLGEQLDRSSAQEDQDQDLASPPTVLLDGSMEMPAECSEDSNKMIIESAPKVYYGTEEPTHVSLQPSQVTAIGNFYGCTGTIIAPRWVITASHCGLSQQAEICFDRTVGNPSVCISGVRVIGHPEADLALLELSQDFREVRPDIDPIILFPDPLDQSWIGQTAEAAGYGSNERGEVGIKAFTAEPIVEIWNDLITIDGQGRQGVCFGDSGGPLMVMADDGVPRIIGVLSYGDQSCVGLDHFTRIDSYLEWIEEHTGPVTVPEERSCEELAVSGRCNPEGTVATLCTDEMVEIQRCEAGEHCAWSTQAEGWRCLPDDEDTCEGVTYYGQCQDGVLQWCDQGTLQTRNCLACGERCVEHNTQIGWTCQISHCGELDEFGECNGEQARWCDGGEVEMLDCEDQGQICDFFGPNTGYFCMDEGSCGEVDYLGACHDQVSIWCDHGQRQVLDCAEDGRTCQYVNNRVGYYCTDCGEVDYLGRCDDQLATWCNHRGQLEQLDCTERGEVCRFVNDEIGYFCAESNP